MNPRDIVKAVFRFERTDEIPHWISIGGGDIERRLVAHYGTTNWREGHLKTYMAGGHIDFAYAPLADGTYLDAFGTSLQPGNVTHIIKPALEKPALDGYRWPDVKQRIDWDAFASEIARSPELFHLRGLAFGLFERAWLMRGFENFLMDLYEHPGFVDDLLDGILAIHLQAIDPVAARPLDLFEQPFPGGYPAVWSLPVPAAGRERRALALFNVDSKPRRFTILPAMEPTTGSAPPEATGNIPFARAASEPRSRRHSGNIDLTESIQETT